MHQWSSQVKSTVKNQNLAFLASGLDLRRSFNVFYVGVVAVQSRKLLIKRCANLHGDFALTLGIDQRFFIQAGAKSEQLSDNLIVDLLCQRAPERDSLCEVSFGDALRD